MNFLASGASRYSLLLVCPGHLPLLTWRSSVQAKAVPGSSLGVTVFDFAPSLATYMRSASLVISHAGEEATLSSCTTCCSWKQAPAS